MVWEERVPAKGTRSFVFRAKRGQKLSLGMIDDTNEGSMDLGKISIEPNTDETFEMEIEVSKDYYFSVTNNSRKSTSFRIFITLENKVIPTKTAPLPPNTFRVQFGKGETSSSVTKTISAQGSIDFLINCRKGQTISYTIGYDFRDSDIEGFLTEPGLQDISQTVGPKARNEFTVKKSGDHRLTINNTSRRKATITLYIDID